MPMTTPKFDFQSYLPFTDILFARHKGLKTLEKVHAHLVMRERLLLYSVVLARAPERCLEIGVAQGGSSRIIHQALEDLGQGALVSIDPKPQIDFDWNEIANRATLLYGSSPQALERAREIAGGPFDFVFVDGDHSTIGVRNDLLGLLKVTEPGATILLHDTYYPPTATGIDWVLARRRGYSDGGILSTTRNPGIENGWHETAFGGLRLLTRVGPRPRRAGLILRRARAVLDKIRGGRRR